MHTYMQTTYCPQLCPLRSSWSTLLAMSLPGFLGEMADSKGGAGKVQDEL